MCTQNGGATLFWTLWSLSPRTGVSCLLLRTLHDFLSLFSALLVYLFMCSITETTTQRTLACLLALALGALAVAQALIESQYQLMSKQRHAATHGMLTSALLKARLARPAFKSDAHNGAVPHHLPGPGGRFATPSLVPCVAERSLRSLLSEFWHSLNKPSMTLQTA